MNDCRCIDIFKGNSWSIVEGDLPQHKLVIGDIKLRLPQKMKARNEIPTPFIGHAKSPSPRDVIGCLLMLIRLLKPVKSEDADAAKDTLMRDLASHDLGSGFDSKNTLAGHASFARTFISLLALCLATNEYGVYQSSALVPYDDETPADEQRMLCQNQHVLYNFLLSVDRQATKMMLTDFTPIALVKKTLSSVKYYDDQAKGGVVTTLNGKREHKVSIFAHHIFLTQHVHPNFCYVHYQIFGYHNSFVIHDGGNWGNLCVVSNQHPGQAPSLVWLGSET